MEFRCRVATEGGQILEATYAAENEARLRRELEEKGLFLLSIQGGRGLSLGRLALPRRRKIPSNDFIIFNQEMATLLKAGLPLVQSLDILRRRVKNLIFKAALDDIYERVRSGSSLSDAFDAQGGLFTPVYNASLMAGEKSGSLEQVLRRYVQHVKVLAAVRGQLISALIYPVILLLLAGSVITLIVFEVVPQFAELYKEMGHGAELPMSTAILVAVSTKTISRLPYIIPAVLGIVGGIWYWLRRPGSMKQVDAMMLRAPYLGPLLRKFATAQVARTIATLLSGGIPLVNSVEIAARAVGNRAVAADLLDIVQQVREGSSLGTALAKHNTFPDVAIEMVEVGESTGALTEMLTSVADFYDEENKTSLERFGNLVQPALLIVMGFIIAALLLSLYMPLFNLSSAVTG